MRDQKIVATIGGISGIILSVAQLAGIILHGSIPVDPVDALGFIYNHSSWSLTHIILIFSYFTVVGFYLGLKTTFSYLYPMVQIGGYLIFVGAFLGALHFTIHFSIFKYSAQAYQEASQTANKEVIATFYHMSHHYAHLLNRLSLFIMMIVEFIFSFYMLRDGQFKKWIAILGLVASALMLATIPIIELVLPRPTGDLVFAGMILPTIVWIFLTALAILRRKPGVGKIAVMLQ